MMKKRTNGAPIVAAKIVACIKSIKNLFMINPLNDVHLVKGQKMMRLHLGNPQ